MKTHAEHETTVAIGRTMGYLLCLDCRVIAEDLLLCGATTKRGGSCRWAVQPGAANAAHPHVTTVPREPKQRQPKVRLEPRPRVYISPAEAQWLRDILRTHGQIDGDSIALTDIKRGQAELLTGRYGGIATGGAHEWQWRCEGQQAALIIASIQQA